MIGLPVRRTGVTAIAAAGAAIFAAAFGGAVAAQATPSPTEESPCTAVSRTWVAPETIDPGATAVVTTHVALQCPGGPDTVRHIVVVADASASMAGEPQTIQARALRALIADLPLDEGRTRVGLVSVSGEATVHCELTADAAALAACVSAVGATGGSCIDCGLRQGHAVLRRGRGLVDPGTPFVESMVVISDGANAGGCEPLRAEADVVKADRVQLKTVCVGTGCDVACLRQAATAPRHFFEGRLPGQLAHILYVVRQTLMDGTVQQVSLRYEPSPGLPLIVAGGPIARLDPDGSATWTQHFVPTEGITVWLGISPTVAARLPALAAIRGELIDHAGRRATIDVDVPVVTVLGDGRLPSPTPPAGLHLADNALVVAPARPAAGTAAAVRYAVSLGPPDRPLGSHVVLVADTSGSMTGAPLAALKQGLRTLVDGLPLGADPSFRVGVIAFNQDARPVLELSDDAAAMAAAIDGLTAGGGTCIECGLVAAAAMLDAGRPAPGVEDVLLFSDGATATSCRAVTESAATLRAAGATLHTVCLTANGCDSACLRAAASPGHDRVAARTSEIAPALDLVGTTLRSDRRLESVTLRLIGAPGLRLRPETFRPAPDPGASGAELHYTVRPWPRTGFAFDGWLDAVSDGASPAVVVAEARTRDGDHVRWFAEAPRELPTARSPAKALFLPWAAR